MDRQRFEKLAGELAARDRGLEEGLRAAREAAERLREAASAAVSAFREAARAQAADHLADIAVGGVEPDAKHVDCVQLRIWRGRWELVCVAKAAGKVTVVGPFQRGKDERPCLDFPLEGDAAERGLEERLLELIRRACGR